MNQSSQAEPALTGKSIVVTGASRGLGLAFARRLASAGAALVLNARDAAALADLCAEIEAGGGRAIPIGGSVADDAVAERLIRTCVDAYGTIDVLVNNAGIVRDRTLMKMSTDDFDEVVAVNLRGTWACGRHAAIAMRETGGVILNVVSNVAFHGSVGQSNYAAAKAGIAGLTRAWSHELARYGIRVNAIWPVALTDMTNVVVERLAAHAQKTGAAAPRPHELGIGDPADVAEVVVFLAGDRAAELTGQIITFNGVRAAVWSHPEERSIELRSQPWTAADLAQAFASETLRPEPMHEPVLVPPAA